MSAKTVLVTAATSGRGWASAWRGRDNGARHVIEAAIGALPGQNPQQGTVEVEFTSDAAVQALNKRFRGKDKPTNVLSFANPSAPFGGIALAYETIRDEAGTQGKPFVHHAKHMILHGFLHLCGYDHETVSERRLMERLEIRILAAMGIPNPYLLEK